MSRGRRYQPEQVVNLLRQIEVAVPNEKTAVEACKEAEIVEQTDFRWASGIWRSAGGSSEAAEEAGAGEREAIIRCPVRCLSCAPKRRL
ncbi:hypothetical protein BDD14_1819 [Edaphobacter modestus]|uniref:Transposase n=1 Tax=Edaphobacter modestus TaxID=388466 RepID=A0A4Q7YRN4_9BACT|nr:hypothetical protein BDD14_1819 [Edaphobacter modestus]